MDSPELLWTSVLLFSLLEFFIQWKFFFNLGVFGIFINFFNIFQDWLFIPFQKYIKINILEIQYEWLQNKKDFQFANKNINSHQILIGISRKQAIHSWKYQPWCGTINFQEIIGLTYVLLNEIQDSSSESDWTERSLSRYQFTRGDQTRGQKGGYQWCLL